MSESASPSRRSEGGHGIEARRSTPLRTRVPAEAPAGPATNGGRPADEELLEAHMHEVPADDRRADVDPAAAEESAARGPASAGEARPEPAMVPVPEVRDRSGEADSQETLAEARAKILVRNLDFWYGDRQVLFGNDLEVAERRVTAIIGPSGCGKSTHIRVYNRMFELYRDQRASGTVLLDGENLLDPEMDLIDLRRRVGMIFQRPTPFPMSVFDNVAYGLRLHYKISRSTLEERVESALRDAALWDEVKDKLDEPGTALSGGQQQRLCIARAIAVEPEVLLMDEPTSAVDPVATAKLEELIDSLKDEYTIVIVTHNMQQAARISDFTAFFYKGYVVEFGPTERIFTNPSEKQTEDYITGRFG